MPSSIQVEIVSAERCKSHQVGDLFVFAGLKTEAGMCIKLFHALYAELRLLQRQPAGACKSITVTCPDGLVRATLTRMEH